MNIVAIIPARMGSTRFPGKPLALLRGKPMIQHVYERTQQVKGIDEVIIVTPDKQIVDAAESLLFNVAPTHADNATGTDAVAEIAKKLTYDIIVNVQGDLPYFHPSMVEEAIQALIAHPPASMATVKTPIRSAEEWYSSDVVKVVTDDDGYALYFSRAPIPAHKRPPGLMRDPLGYRHIGIYVYWRSFLLTLAQSPQTKLERCESLEQLRVLERGHKIIVSETGYQTIEVDTPEDLSRAEKAMMVEWGV